MIEQQPPQFFGNLPYGDSVYGANPNPGNYARGLIGTAASPVRGGVDYSPQGYGFNGDPLVRAGLTGGAPIPTLNPPAPIAQPAPHLRELPGGDRVAARMRLAIAMAKHKGTTWQHELPAIEAAARKAHGPFNTGFLTALRAGQ